MRLKSRGGVMKLLIVLGTRPEAIKLIPVYHEAIRQGHTAHIYFTSQHEDLVDPLFEIFGVSDSDVHRPSPYPSRTLSGMFTHILKEVSEHICSCAYDYLIVQGDTTSTVAGGVAGAYTKVPVVHVEAGLRSFDRTSPFPEEINRRMVSHIADLHFTPTDASTSNLLNEGIIESSIYMVGNTGIDALVNVNTRIDSGDLLCSEHILKIIQSFGHRKLILVTGHRRENQDGNLDKICREISKLSQELKDTHVFVYSVHPSPNVRLSVQKYLQTHESCIAIPALEYHDFIKLMSIADVIVTDSGGIQEEAPTFNTFVIVTRDTTERSESLKLGYSELVSNDMDALRKAVFREIYVDKSSRSFINPYGDGKAASKIIDILSKKHIGDHSL